MAFTFGFYNSHNHDRIYDAKSVSRIFDGLVTDGVYSTIGDRFVVRPATDANTVIVGSGRAWFDHTWNYNDTAMLLEGPESHTLFDRWDAIVLDVNTNVEYRTNDIIWVQGTASSTPVKPTMIHEYDHNQYPLAYVYRRAKVEYIEASDIDNVIGTAECPYSESSLTDTKNIAPVEENDTATRAYLLGEYIIWHNELYKVTTPISKGYNIIPEPESGYNVTRTTIASELYQKFVFDTTPTSGSTHPLTSDGIYKALGNNKIIQPTTTVNQNDPTNGKAVITSKGLYTALDNRTKLSILHGDMQNHPNSWANYELPTTYTLTIALGNKHKLQPTDTPGQTHSNPNCEYVMTSKAFTFGAPASGGTKYITNGQVYTALGNRTSIQTSAPTQNSSNLITSGQVYAALGNRTGINIIYKNYNFSSTQSSYSKGVIVYITIPVSDGTLLNLFLPGVAINGHATWPEEVLYNGIWDGVYHITVYALSDSNVDAGATIAVRTTAVLLQ